jgi:hypothetical protein
LGWWAYHNNPAKIATSEAKRIWPGLRSLTEHPDLLLSIGSGYDSSAVAAQNKEGENLSRWGFLRSLTVLKQCLLQNMNSEAIWKEHFQRLKSSQPSRYIRLNPAFEKNAPSLDMIFYLRNGVLEKVANTYLQRKDIAGKIDELVKRLISSSFYLHLSEYPTVDRGGAITFKGLWNTSPDTKAVFGVLAGLF